MNCPKLNLYGLEVMILPKNTLLYRAGMLHNDRPEWFGSYLVAMNYNKKMNKSFWTKQTLRDLHLFNFHKANITKFYDSIKNSLSDSDKQIFEKVCFCNLTPDQKKILTTYPPYYHNNVFNFIGSFQYNKQDYFSLLFAKLLCSFGFDGWYVEPNKVLEKEKLLSGPRREEILLCIPDLVSAIR